MKITANMVTVTRIVLMPIPGYLLYGGASELMAALIAIIVLGLTDWLDGIMARREGPSVLGSLLDPIADKIFIAVIYLPLAERGVIPVWMAASIFARDFLVTALRMSLSLRGAPMRTSTLAKFKTAFQMTGIGYVILYMAAPYKWYSWIFLGSPVAIALCLILYRIARRSPQGLRSATLMAAGAVAMALRLTLGPQPAISITLYVITAMTLLSGISYLADAWGALKGKAGSAKEGARFALQGLLMPVLFIMLIGRYQSTGMSLAIILVITMELAVGGLENLLAGKKIVPRFRWIALKSSSQAALSAAALILPWLGIETHRLMGEICIVAALLVTIVYFAIAFVKHRTVYLSAL